MARKITKIKRTNDLGIKIALSKASVSDKCAGVGDISINSNKYVNESGDTIIEIAITGGLDPIKTIMQCDDPECGKSDESGPVTLTKIDNRHYVITVPQFTNVKAISFIAYDECGHVDVLTEGFGPETACDLDDYKPPEICIVCVEKSYDSGGEA